MKTFNNSNPIRIKAYSFLLAVLLSFFPLLSHACDCSNNLLQNGSFESGTAFWTWDVDDDFFITMSYASCGSFNAFLDWDEGPEAWVWQEVDIAPGKFYNLSFYAGATDVSFNHFVRIAFYDSADNLLDSKLQFVDHDANEGNLWQYTIAGAMSPAGTDYLRIEAFADGAYLELDAFCLQEIEGEPCAGNILGVYLYDQATDQKIPSIPALHEGQQIFAHMLPDEYYIVAEMQGNIESCKITLNGEDQSCDNFGMFTWPQDAEFGNSWEPVLGEYELDLSVYNYNGCATEACDQEVFTIEILEDPCWNHEMGDPNSRISMGVVVSPDIIGSAQNIVNATFLVFNMTDEPMSDVNLVIEESLFSGEDFESTMVPSFSGDPNGNGVLDPGELWFYTGVRSYSYELGDIFIIAGGVEANGECGMEIAACADLLFTYGVNMDLEVEEKEYYEVGETIKVDLISRLLVDEDASQRPGLKSVKVGDYSVSVPLAKTRWELRDLELSTNLLNDGVAFDPFFAPSNLELSNFSDSNGSDSGRNTDNVLDEAESIETVRKPCSVFGESDISCEFPDWMFSYEYTFETSDISDCFEINATDAFTIWKSEEFPAGSGSFQEFENVTNQFNEGGIDELCIKVRKKQKEFISGLVYPNPSTGVINIVSDLYSGTYEIYNLNGKLVKQGALNANQKIQLNVYPSGVYFAKLFDETEAEVQSIRFILNN